MAWYRSGGLDNIPTIYATKMGEPNGKFYSYKDFMAVLCNGNNVVKSYGSAAGFAVYRNQTAKTVEYYNIPHGTTIRLEFPSNIPFVDVPKIDMSQYGIETYLDDENLTYSTTANLTALVSVSGGGVNLEQHLVATIYDDTHYRIRLVLDVRNTSGSTVQRLYVTFNQVTTDITLTVSNINYRNSTSPTYCREIKVPLLNNIFDDKDENYIIFTLTNDNKVTVQTPSGTPVNLISAQTALATYSFNICKILYLSGNTFFILYNWQTSGTARSITYGRIISANQDGSIYLTTARSIFAASLADWGIKAAGSCYSGNIFPLNFEDNREVKSLGITYVRDHLTSANVNTQRTTWQGYYVMYSSVTASRIALVATQASNLASVASCVPSTGADVGYFDTLFDGMVHYTTTSANVTTYRTFISRTSATNVGAMGSFITGANIKDENDNVIPASFIGKLDDGNFVAVDGTAIYIMQLQFTTTSGASNFKIRKKFTASDTPNETLTYTPDGMIMLRGGVLFDRINGYLYQIMEAPKTSVNMYEIKKIGRSNYQKLDLIKSSSNRIWQVARPRGVYSNTFYGINQGEPV